jgi:glucose-6-phosphate dehydrogenase assembly protein OpcA
MTTLTFAEQVYADSLVLRNKLETINNLFTKYSVADSDWGGDLSWKSVASEALDANDIDAALLEVLKDVDSEVLFNISNRYQGFAALLQHAVTLKGKNNR